MATQELLRSALVRRALAHPELLEADQAEKSHVRQTVIAREYHERIGRLDAETLRLLYERELGNGADFKRIHRGSIFGLPAPHRKTKQEAKEWLRRVERAPRKPHGLKASAVALPPITANTLRLAAYLAALASKQDHTLFSYSDLARELRVSRRTVAYCVATLARRGLLIVHRRQERHHNGYQLQRQQARNDYEIFVTRTPP